MIIENSFYKKAYNLALNEAKAYLFNFLRIPTEESKSDLLTITIANKITGKIIDSNTSNSKVTIADIMKDKIEIPKFYIDAYNKKLEYFKILKEYIGYTFINYLESNDFYYTVTKKDKNSCILSIQSFDFKFLDIVLEIEGGQQKLYRSSIYAGDVKIYFKDELEKDLITYIDANLFGIYRLKVKNYSF